jgi:hypothetical protein
MIKEPPVEQTGDILTEADRCKGASNSKAIVAHGYALNASAVTAIAEMFNMYLPSVLLKTAPRFRRDIGCSTEPDNLACVSPSLAVL